MRITRFLSLGVFVGALASACSSSDAVTADPTKTLDGGTGCKSGAECSTGLCNADNGQCLPASAGDGKKNGSETDVDCGGTAAAPCSDLKACLIATDCKSSVCTANVCQLPTTTDGVKNGAETDVDCGGGAAPKCADTKACTVRDDCTSEVCVGNVCTAPTDADGVQNGTETDIDCGGPTAKRCDTGGKCTGADDCASKNCDAAAGGTNECLAPTYNDHITNGTETDQDCGGAVGHECGAGKICAVGTDCVSGGCNDQKVCAIAKSCTNPGGAGAYTCGLGGEGGGGAKAWEDCCTTIPVTASGVTVNLDKYQVTAGRYRVFLESVGYNVRSFVQSARANNKIPAAPGNGTKSVLDAAWDLYLPTSFEGSDDAGEINDCDQGSLDPNYGKCCDFYAVPAGGCGTLTNTGGYCHYWNPTTNTCPAGHATNYAGVYSSVYNQLGGTIFRGNSQSQTGCFVGAPGTHTFRFPDNKQDGDTPDQPQSIYDTKSMTCLNYLMAQSFCVWDGGRLETLPEWQAAWGAGTYPWTSATETRGPEPQDTNTYFGCRFPTAYDGDQSNCAAAYTWDATKTSIELANWKYSYEYPNLVSTDFIVFINAPGRLKGRGPAGHADVLGNVFELTSTVAFNASYTATPTPFNATHRWSGNGSWEVHDFNKGGGGTTMLLNKYGKLGMRCAKP